MELKWKNIKADEVYPLCITRWMDVNGDWQYCLSHGKIWDGAQYISISELEHLPDEK